MKRSACITLCTAGRPKMLRRCLQSIVAQELPENWEFSLVVVENAAEPVCRDLVLQETASTSLQVEYAVEERRGIPIARNHSMEKALTTGADWILFVDDDEVVTPRWLVEFCRAAERIPADIFVGPVMKQYPASTPSWFVRRHNLVPPTGERTQRVNTGNTMMHADLVRPEGLALRFNEEMRYTGGSDTEFFKRALAAGKTAVGVFDAVATEEVPESRVTLRAYLLRVARMKANRVRLYMANRGRLRTYLLFPSRILAKFPLSLVLLSLGSAMYPVARTRGARSLVKGMRVLAEIGGYTMGLSNRMLEPYRSLDGH